VVKDKVFDIILPSRFDEWDLFFHALALLVLETFGYQPNPTWGIEYENELMGHIYIQHTSIGLLRIKILRVKELTEGLKVTYQLERKIGKRWFKHPLKTF
jgi:hypothetical protein